MSQNSICLENRKWHNIFPWLHPLKHFFLRQDISSQIKTSELLSYILISILKCNFKQDLLQCVGPKVSHRTSPLDSDIFIFHECPVLFQNIYHLGFHNNLWQQVLNWIMCFEGKVFTFVCLNPSGWALHFLTFQSTWPLLLLVL